MTSTSSLLPTVNVSAITGLPELPENYYWDVRLEPADYYSPPYVRVYLCESKIKVTRFRKREIKYVRDVDYQRTKYDQADKKLEQWLVNAIKDLSDTVYTRQANKFIIEQFEGQYPPKSLPLEDK